MPRFHHANLAVPPGAIEAQSRFLVDVLGYRSIDPGERFGAMGAVWFEADDGTQIHLSSDEDHRPSTKAHVAIELDEIDELERRLGEAEVAYSASDLGDGSCILFCADPGGNRWELRGRRAAAV